MSSIKVAHSISQKRRTGDVSITENLEFSGLFLSPEVLQGLSAAGFRRPSPIQLKAIPLGRCGLDLIVQAKSGTGKTCVFTVIALEGILTESSGVQVLVLAPTREIALQIQEVIRTIGQYVTGLHCQAFIGGLPLGEDKNKIKKCHIAVGTPGRVKQMIETNILQTDSIRLFILDEADKLLEEGFQEQINWIYSTLPENKQMLALSATYPEYLAKHLTAYMRNPTFVRLNILDPALLGIRQYYQEVPFHPLPQKSFEEKSKHLINLLSSVTFQQCLVFSNLQVAAENLSDLLNSKGWPSAFIAGSQDQKLRIKAMEKLKKYECRVLISTDLTSRGIDADKVDLVVNLDLPWDHETYLHRIGRAGRFGSYGAAVSFVLQGKESAQLEKIQKKCNTHIKPLPEPVPQNLTQPVSNVCLDDVVTTEQLITSPNPSTKPANLDTSKDVATIEQQIDQANGHLNGSGVSHLDDTTFSTNGVKVRGNDLPKEKDCKKNGSYSDKEMCSDIPSAFENSSTNSNGAENSPDRNLNSPSIEIRGTPKNSPSAYSESCDSNIVGLEKVELSEGHAGAESFVDSSKMCSGEDCTEGSVASPDECDVGLQRACRSSSLESENETLGHEGVSNETVEEVSPQIEEQLGAENELPTDEAKSVEKIEQSDKKESGYESPNPEGNEDSRAPENLESRKCLVDDVQGLDSFAQAFSKYFKRSMSVAESGTPKYPTFAEARESYSQFLSNPRKVEFVGKETSRPTSSQSLGKNEDLDVLVSKFSKLLDGLHKEQELALAGHESAEISQLAQTAEPSGTTSKGPAQEMPDGPSSDSSSGLEKLSETKVIFVNGLPVNGDDQEKTGAIDAPNPSTIAVADGENGLEEKSDPVRKKRAPCEARRQRGMVRTLMMIHEGAVSQQDSEGANFGEREEQRCVGSESEKLNGNAKGVSGQEDYGSELMSDGHKVQNGLGLVAEVKEVPTRPMQKSFVSKVPECQKAVKSGYGVETFEENEVRENDCVIFENGMVIRVDKKNVGPHDDDDDYVDDDYVDDDDDDYVDGDGGCDDDFVDEVDKDDDYDDDDDNVEDDDDDDDEDDSTEATESSENDSSSESDLSDISDSDSDADFVEDPGGLCYRGAYRRVERQHKYLSNAFRESVKEGAEVGEHKEQTFSEPIDLTLSKTAKFKAISTHVGATGHSLPRKGSDERRSSKDEHCQSHRHNYGEGQQLLERYPSMYDSYDYNPAESRRVDQNNGCDPQDYGYYGDEHSYYGNDKYYPEYSSYTQRSDTPRSYQSKSNSLQSAEDQYEYGYNANEYSGAQDYYGDYNGYYGDNNGYYGDYNGYYGDNSGYYGDSHGYHGDKNGYYGDYNGYYGDNNGYYGDNDGYYGDQQGYVDDQYGYSGNGNGYYRNQNDHHWEHCDGERIDSSRKDFNGRPYSYTENFAQDQSRNSAKPQYSHHDDNPQVPECRQDQRGFQQPPDTSQYKDSPHYQEYMYHVKQAQYLEHQMKEEFQNGQFTQRMVAYMHKAYVIQNMCMDTMNKYLQERGS